MNARAKVVSAAVLCVAAMWVTSRADAQFPAPPVEDKFEKGMIWKGTMTQKAGKYRGNDSPEFEIDCEFEITKVVEGGKFDAKLTEKLGGKTVVVYLVENAEVTPLGPGKGFKLKWTSQKVDSTTLPGTFSNGLYEGELWYGRIKGKWTYPENKEGTDLIAEFTWRK